MTTPRVRPRGVLCCGNMVHDILVRAVEQFVWNTTTWVESIEQHLGGNGASTAYALGKLGVPVRLLSMAGRDSFAESLLARLAGAGVDLGFVARAGGPNATTVALVHPGGARLFLHRVGASAQAFAEPPDLTAQVLEGVSHFHLGNPFALPLLRQHAAETLRRARAAGLTTSLDAGWDARGRWSADLGPCFPLTDLLFVNEEEARRLAGAAESSDAARRLRELGAAIVVVKLGGAGCAVFSAETELHVPAFDVPVVDTTGAGDCFAGAFLAALHHGRTLEEAARLANAVAALTIQQLGATEGVRGYEETEAWMASFGGPARPEP